jgi:zinc protease
MRTRAVMTRGVLLLVVAMALAASPAAPAPPSASVPPAGLDRNVAPKPGPVPPLRVPVWEKSRLGNGAELVVTPKTVGGAYNFEPPERAGLAGFTAQMLSEGTVTRSADELSDAQQLLGTSIGAGVGGESGSIGFTALKDKWEPALFLLMDMLVNPTFPAEALERIRGRTLVQLAQAKDQPNAISANVFAKVLFGDAHPYGRVTTEDTVRAITREEVVAFHKAFFRPGRAVVSVTGDVTPAGARAVIEKAFLSWPAGGERPTFSYPAPPAPRATTIYLVDKPKAAQSIFALGLPGPPRDTPDYHALLVMNHLLGGLFQSRLNHNIREVKGYSYGVNSSFGFGRGPGAFRAGGGIVTANTHQALVEFMKELKGVQGAIPFTEDEIAEGKESLIQGLPRRFNSVNAIGGAVASIYTQGLPETYFQDYAREIGAVTSADLVRVARKYIDLDHLNIVIVGDRTAIEAPLRETGIAPISVLDAQAKPVTTPVSAP